MQQILQRGRMVLSVRPRRPVERASALHSSPTAAAFGTPRAVVSASTSLLTRSEYFGAKVWAIMPPSDRPSQWLRSLPGRSCSPRTSSASPLSVSVPGGERMRQREPGALPVDVVVNVLAASACVDGVLS